MFFFCPKLYFMSSICILPRDEAPCIGWHSKEQSSLAVGSPDVLENTADKAGFLLGESKCGSPRAELGLS